LFDIRASLIEWSDKMEAREVNKNDYYDIAQLEIERWGSEAASIEMIKSRHEIFPRGSIVVENDDGKIVGYGIVQKVSRICNDSWYVQTDDGSIKATHTDKGHILYGVGMSGRENGVSDLLIDYAYKTFIEPGECYMLALGSRVPGFRVWDKKTAKGIIDYIHTRNSDGHSIDPELKLFQKHGFELLYEIDGYFPCEKSLDFGAMVVLR
jgi:ribosomal protein S18 acetylase RimI-like enzyme